MIMCTFAAAWYPRFCLEQHEVYMHSFSSISVIDCKSVFVYVTKPGAPTGILDMRCAIDLAIVKGCLKRMRAMLKWGATSLMLGDAWTKDRTEAADVLRACPRAGAYQLADESAMLVRAQEEKATRAQRQAAQHATGSQRPAPPPGLYDGEVCSGRFVGAGADVLGGSRGHVERPLGVARGQGQGEGSVLREGDIPEAANGAPR